MLLARQDRRIRAVRHVLVVCGWLLLVGALNLALPQLETVIADDSTPVVPVEAESVQALAAMDREFGNGKSTSVVFVVVERDSGLRAADRRYLQRLVPRLRADPDVSFVQDVRRRPALLDALTSRDGQAAYLQVGIPGATGAPTSISQIEGVREIVRSDLPPGLEVAVTGPAATIADMSTEVEHSLVRITVITVGVIALLLLLMYRSIAVMAVVLGYIGITLAAARALTSLAGLHLFNVSTFTGSFLTGVVLGAATDYAIFLISRYHEQRRLGVHHPMAVRLASRRVAAVIAGSASTVIAASACMALAEVGIFNTTGPAIALGVATALALSLSLLPSLIALVGSRGWLDPRPAPAKRQGWQRLADTVVARPGRILVAGLVPLVFLAAFQPTLEPSFDERSGQPDSSDSNRGYELIAAHYPPNEVLPYFVLIRSDHDLRNPRDLAALEQSAASVARTPGVHRVRSVTRPSGAPISEASLASQVGLVGDRLGDAEARVADGETGAERLARGADALHTGAGRVDAGAGRVATGAVRLATGADRAAAGAGRLLAGVGELREGLDRLATGARSARDGSARLRRAADALADGLEVAHDQTKVAVDGLGMAYDALQRSVACGVDPICRRAREGVRQVYVGERDRLLPGLREAAAGARRIADGTVDLHEGLARLDAGLDRAARGAASLAAGHQRLHEGIGRLVDGTDRLSEGTGRLARGTDRLVDGAGRIEQGSDQIAPSLGELRGGLDRAAGYLHRTARAGKDPAIGGFYLPPRALNDRRFQFASSLFVAPDGRTARMVVIGEGDAFSRDATDLAAHIDRAAATGLHGTRRASSDVETTGVAPLNGDLEKFSQRDFELVAAGTLAAVFLILLLVLRGVVVAVVLLASVVLSYAAAMGLSVLVWQELLEIPIEWTVSTIAFVLLVSVGADYNLLLMKRMREEAPDGSTAGIARAAAATGGVITAAGVIFAASMFAMMSGSVTTLMQIGFTIGTGVLMDTFIVRTLVVPGCAALLGHRLWWPSRPGEATTG